MLEKKIRTNLIAGACCKVISEVQYSLINTGILIRVCHQECEFSVLNLRSNTGSEYFIKNDQDHDG